MTPAYPEVRHPEREHAVKRKRLQHAVDVFCQMFCGWRLANSYQRLEQIGSGTLQVDALTAACSHNGAPIDPLSIAREIQAWLMGDLASHGISVEQIAIAELTVGLTLSETKRESRAGCDQHFDRRGRHINPDVFIRCEIQCRSRIVTAEAAYTSRHDDIEEWPRGWPSNE